MTKNTPSVPSTYQIPRARRTNGATQTFRRPSHATSLSGSTAHSASRDAPASQNASSSGVYVPPHAQPGRNGSYAEGRFSRDQLTQLFRTQRDNDELADGLSNLSMGVLEQHAANGISSASWGRNHDHSRDAQSGVDQCWDRDGSIEPLSLRDLTDEEREVCSCILHMCSQSRLTCIPRLGFPFVCQFSDETSRAKHQQGWHSQGRPLLAQSVHIAGRRDAVRPVVANQRSPGRSPPRH
jgi:hypothetical protein